MGLEASRTSCPIGMQLHGATAYVAITYNLRNKLLRNEIKMEATSTCSVNVDAGTGTSLYSQEKRGTIQLTRAHEEAIRFGLE